MSQQHVEFPPLALDYLKARGVIAFCDLARTPDDGPVDIVIGKGDLSDDEVRGMEATVRVASHDGNDRVNLTVVPGLTLR